MAFFVQKYGGTSVGSVERIEAVADKVKSFHDAGHRMVIVLSAMSGETNRLIALAQSLADKPSAREMDALLATGEQVTIALLAIALKKRGIDATSFTGWQAGIKTSSLPMKARIESIDTEALTEVLDAGGVAIAAGFQGIDADHNITTLGRGGSDTTAVALAAALKADECQIYTDVDGVYTTDPRIAPAARRLEKITFEEMLELASLGSKVLQIRAVEFAGKYKVPLRVLSSMKEGNGTLITVEEKSAVENPIISGIAFNRDEAKLTIKGVPDVPGIASDILGAISDQNIEVDMIVQNVSEDGTTDFTFTVNRIDYKPSLDILNTVAEQLKARSVTGTDEICKVSLVGVGMRSHAGIASKMFSVLADENINILAITTSEIKISVVIAEKYLELAVRALHTAFDLDIDAVEE